MPTSILTATHHGYVLTNPNIIAYDGITLKRQLIFDRRNSTSPVTAHDVKWVSRHTIHPVVGSVHHELNPFCNGTKLPDNQLVTDKIVEMSDMFLKLVSTIHIIIVGVVSNDDTWILHYILNEAKSW